MKTKINLYLNKKQQTRRKQKLKVKQILAKYKLNFLQIALKNSFPVMKKTNKIALKSALHQEIVNLDIILHALSTINRKRT